MGAATNMGDGAGGWTPGPWEALKGVEQSDDMRCGVAAVRGDLRYLVATIENGAPGDICDTEFANARLIAAAPSLYSALAEAVELLEASGYSTVEMRAALAKARGESAQ